MWQRFTEGARRALLRGQEEAIKTKSEAVFNVHLLLGLVCEPESGVIELLRRLGITPKLVEQQFL